MIVSWRVRVGREVTDTDTMERSQDVNMVFAEKNM